MFNELAHLALIDSNHVFHQAPGFCSLPPMCPGATNLKVTQVTVPYFLMTLASGPCCQGANKRQGCSMSSSAPRDPVLPVANERSH